MTPKKVPIINGGKLTSRRGLARFINQLGRNGVILKNKISQFDKSSFAISFKYVIQLRIWLLCFANSRLKVASFSGKNLFTRCLHTFINSKIVCKRFNEQKIHKKTIDNCK